MGTKAHEGLVEHFQAGGASSSVQDSRLEGGSSTPGGTGGDGGTSGPIPFVLKGAKAVCGRESPQQLPRGLSSFCQLPPGHEGPHVNGGMNWTDLRCGATTRVAGVTESSGPREISCTRDPGHYGAHDDGAGQSWSAAPPLGPKSRELEPMLRCPDCRREGRVGRDTSRLVVTPCPDCAQNRENAKSDSRQEVFPFARPRSVRHIAADLVNHGRRLGYTEACRKLRDEQMQMLVRILEASGNNFLAPEASDEPAAFRRGYVELRNALASWHAALEETPLPPPPFPPDAEKLVGELGELVARKPASQPAVPLRLIAAGALMRLARAITPARPSPETLKARAQAEELVAKLEQLIGIKPSEPKA